MAEKYIKELKNRKVYDFHGVNPEEYNLTDGGEESGQKKLKREGKQKNDTDDAIIESK